MKLFESMPRDLAKALKKKYPGIFKNSNPDIDFEHSTYTKISPEEATKLYYAQQSEYVFALYDNSKIACIYMDGFNQRYDKFSTKVGDKRTPDLDPEDVYRLANVIYKMDTKMVDKSLINKRRENQLSKFNNPTFQNRVKEIDQPQKLLDVLRDDADDPNDVPEDVVKIPLRYTYIPGYGSPDQDKMVADSFPIYYSKELNGVCADVGLNSYHDGKRWRDLYDDVVIKEYFNDLKTWSDALKYVTKARGPESFATKRIKAIVDFLTQQSGIDAKEYNPNGPLGIDWEKHDLLKNFKASVRNASLEDKAQALLNKHKRLLSDIRDARRTITSLNKTKDDVLDPEEVQYRKDSTKTQLDRLQRKANDLLVEIVEKMEEIDSVDDKYKEKAAEYDKAISKIDEKIDKLEKELLDLTGGKGWIPGVPLKDLVKDASDDLLRKISNTQIMLYRAQDSKKYRQDMKDLNTGQKKIDSDKEALGMDLKDLEKHLDRLTNDILETQSKLDTIGTDDDELLVEYKNDIEVWEKQLKQLQDRLAKELGVRADKFKSLGKS